MKIQKLDHIALYMRDRDAAAGFLTTYSASTSSTAPTATPSSEPAARSASSPCSMPRRAPTLRQG